MGLKKVAGGAGKDEQSFYRFADLYCASKKNEDEEGFCINEH